MKSQKMSTAEKQAALLESIRRIRARLTDGCNNPVCGREFCKSSKNFKYCNVTDPGQISKLALKLAKLQLGAPLRCEDAPFFKVNWDSEKTSLLPAEVELEELKLLYLDVGQGLDSNFLLDDRPVSKEHPSIDFKALASLHSRSDEIPEVRTAFMEVFDSSVKKLATGDTITDINRLRRVLIFCEHPLLFSEDIDIMENMSGLLEAFSNMNEEMMDVLVTWLTTYPSDKLRRIVMQLQQFLTLTFCTAFEDKIEEEDPNLEAIEDFHTYFVNKIWGAMIFLDRVRQANIKYHGNENDFWEEQSPPVELAQFYNSAVNEHFNMKYIVSDLNLWQAEKPSLYQYNWIYDAGTKAKALEIFARSAMRRQLFQSFFIMDSPYFILRVRRDNIIADTLQQLQSHDAYSIRKPMKVKFVGEQGIDEGGVKKEFFQILIRELFDVGFGMFKYIKESDVFWFNPCTFEDAQEFELIGMILGLAIYNNIILDIRFPNLIFKKLLDKPLSFEDFRDFDPALAKGFEQLLTFDGDVENTFCRTFSHTFSFFGEDRVIELKENGANIPVTAENRKEYVELYVDYHMNKSIQKQYKTLHDGFHVVAGNKVREMFTWDELQLLICGSENVDFEALESSARYMDGFDKDSPTIKFFWEICHSLDDENKRKLLSFCTGSDRIPIRGLSDLVLTISKNGDDENHLPTSHTCYNHLLLPEYKNKDIMRERILTAIQNSEGFGLR
jgi:ubiquitin-protein ligase E3 A